MPVEYTGDVDLQQIHQQQTSAELVREANQFSTLPSGVYRIGPADRVEVRRAGPEAPIPGRLEGRIQAPAVGRETGRNGKVFFTVSPEMHKRTNQKGEIVLDAASKLWGNAVKAWGLQAAPLDEVFDAFAKYPLDGYVTEPFKTADGKYVTPRTPEERTNLVNSGAEPANFVQNLGKAK